MATAATLLRIPDCALTLPLDSAGVVAAAQQQAQGSTSLRRKRRLANLQVKLTDFDCWHFLFSYRRGNFSSAINAYTEAVQKDPSLFLCFANRAACFLQLKQFQPCIEDCTAALILLQMKKMEMPEKQPLISEASNVNQVKLLACNEESAGKQFEAFAQESMKLLQDFLHSKEKTIERWYNVAQKKILVRRGLAFCNVKELSKAKQDVDEAFGSDLAVEVLADTFGSIPNVTIM
ncbi:hypothetical protein L7F22_047957 [Adiantum nelumboides]|nr:hypothetical protein [Adiantum nelumboides]